jgi:hypothetical protein
MTEHHNKSDQCFGNCPSCRVSIRQYFGKRDLPPSSVGRINGDPTLLGPKERAGLYHWILK